MGSDDASVVREWLVQSGLRHHTAAFAGMSELALRGLMMQVKTVSSLPLLAAVSCIERDSQSFWLTYCIAHVYRE